MRWGLAISGGGRNGAFAAGAVARLQQELPWLSFDTVSGTSTGALMATPILLGQIDLVTQIYRGGVTEGDLLRRKYLHGILVGEFSCSLPLRGMIERSLDVDALERAWDLGKKAVVTCVNARTGELVRRWSSPENMHDWIDYVLASASVPILMPPVMIEGDDHVDGGLMELVPVEPLAMDEVDAIVVVKNFLPYPTAMSENPRGLGARISRVLDLAISGRREPIDACDVACAASGKPCFVVAPDQDLGPSMDFCPAAMRQVWAKGWEAAERVVKSIAGMRRLVAWS